MIESIPLIQNANDAQQINASIIAMKKASRELDEKIVKLNSLNSELDKKIAFLDSGLNKEIEDRKEAINSLDVASVGGSGKYISAISETDGKISATAGDITSTVSSGNSHPVTSGAAYNAIYGLQRLKNLFVLSNNSGSAKYYKITGITSIAQEYVFLLQAREGELIVISCGFGDNTYKSPKIKRLLNTYSKIIGFTFKDSELYMCVATWAHNVILTQICGTDSANVSISETTQAIYNSGTPITIET